MKRAYVKSYDGETKLMIFLIKDDELLKNVIFGIMSVIVLKKNLIVNPATIKIILKTKIRSWGDKTTDFLTRKIPEVGSDYICWLAILVDSVLKKDVKYLQVFWK